MYQQHQSATFCASFGLPEQDSEQLTQVHVVWSFFKTQATAVVQIHGELRGESLYAHIPVNHGPESNAIFCD